MRALSSNYVPPTDGCISYKTLYAALDELEKDLHQHIHLENNILFPRAVEMEKITV
jgi:regulator of cell morphogenesis and NO signaling